MAAVEERLARIRTAMAEESIDVLAVAGDAWRTDYLRFAVDVTLTEGHALALIQRDGPTRVLVDSPREAARIAVEASQVDVRCVASIAEAAEAANDTNDKARRVVLAPRGAVTYRLGAGPLGETLRAGTALLDRVMLAKSSQELDAVRRAAALADDGYRVFREAARVRTTEYELVAEVEAFLRSRGCPDNFMILASGGREVRGMHPPSDRRLSPGDLVTTELTPCIDGYYAQICRTLVIGEPNAAQRAAFAVFLEALEAGVAAVRPGARAADVARAENEVFRRHGLGDYVTSQYTRVRGHGLGTYPDARPAILEDVELELVPNMTLIVHPNTYHPEVGYLVLGDAVRVTEDGCEVLCQTPRELFSVAG